MRIISFLLFFLVAINIQSFGKKHHITVDEMLFSNATTIHSMVDDLDLDETIKDQGKVDVAEFAEEMKEEILIQALERYQELIDSFPKSEFLFRALNNKGFIELELEDTIKAKKSFQRVLNSNANDKEPGGIGSGLMAEPYANYKNRAAKMLASISIDETNYAQALSYMELTKKYPYHHFCGNEYAADAIYVAELYAKCYIGLKQYSKAYDILLPEIVPNGLANNDDLAELAYNSLLFTYKKDFLKKEYLSAIHNYHIEKIKEEDYSYNKYYIVFLGTKIFIDLWDNWGIDEQNSDSITAKIEQRCRQSEFYKKLNE